uniref:Tyrosinase copper-binding domain-containing protein n=1 Tax=Globodera rostochiensis TaxID=31243 RepID=A0A914HJ01_GLORO
MEFALRAIDPSVCLPYWDSTMDERLPNPTDSIMWSNLFMGTSDNDDGQIANGFLANWITASGHKIQRYLGQMMPSNLLTENQVVATITYREMQGIFAFTEGTSTSNCTQPIPDDEQILEMNHNNVHAWIGGDMAQLVTSTQDPIFFLHHCFVDYVWEQWRIKWQTREEREAQFPPDAQVVACSGSTYCRLNATMLPFQDPVVLISAGLSNDYTDNLYTYAPRPTCKLAGECGSAYLFCDSTTRRYPSPLCCAKIKSGGDCSIFQGNSEEPCFASTCVDGVCKVVITKKVFIVI